MDHVGKDVDRMCRSFRHLSRKNRAGCVNLPISGSSLPELPPAFAPIHVPGPQLSHRHHVDFDPAVFVCLRHHAEPFWQRGARVLLLMLFYYPIAISKPHYCSGLADVCGDCRDFSSQDRWGSLAAASAPGRGHPASFLQS